MPTITKPLRIALYCRVSTSHQDDEAQFNELVALCRRSHWNIEHTFREKVSGTLGSDYRPELKRLLLTAKQRKIDKVIVWSADRLGRSMRHLVNVLAELHDCEVEVFSYKQGIDTSSEMGKMLWNLLGIFAEFENNMRKERQAIGIKHAIQKGIHFGRPAVPQIKLDQIIELRKAGMGIDKICGQLKVGTYTVINTIRKAGMSTAMNGK